MKQVLLELYLLGENPSADEIRRVAGIEGKPTDWSRRLARLWVDRTARPTRFIREHPTWRYPFILPHDAIKQHRLASIESRLARQAASATDFLAQAISEGDAARIQDALEPTALQHRALRAWAFTAMRLADEPDGDVRFRLVAR